MSSNKKTAEKVRELVENHIGLANKLAAKKKKLMPSFVSFEELQSAAFLGLTEAANRFDADRGFCFTTYAYPRISGAINDYLRELGCMTVSLDSSKDEEDFSLKDTLVARETNTEDFFGFVLETLGEQAGNMLHSYYVDRYSMKEIGEQYGVSEGRISQMISGYKKSIRDQWAMVDIAA